MNLDFERQVEFLIVPRPRKNGEGFKDSLYHQINSTLGSFNILRKLREVDSVISDGPGLCLSVFGAYYLLAVGSSNQSYFSYRNCPRCSMLRVSAEPNHSQQVVKSSTI